MERGKIIVLEGNSNTGKTTLAKNLEQKGFVYIPGVRQFGIENGLEIPDIPKNEDEEYENQIALFAIERKRMERALEIARSGKNVVLDRSYLAIIAVAHALDEKGTCMGAYANSMRVYLGFMKRLAKDGLLPDKYLFLTAGVEELQRRNKTRSHVLSDTWMEKGMLDSQEEFFTKYRNKYPKKASVVETDGKSPEEITEEVLRILGINERER